MRTRDELIQHYRHLGRRLADETMSEVERAPLRREQEQVRVEIESMATKGAVK